MTSQLPIQTTKFFWNCLDVHFAPHFEKGSATHELRPSEKVVSRDM